MARVREGSYAMGHPGDPRQQGHYTHQDYPPPHDPFARQGSQRLAATTAVVGLGLAGALAWQNLTLLDIVHDFGGRLPGHWTAMIIGGFVVAFVALVGAALVFARLIAGAFVLLTAAVLTIAAMITAPLLAEGVGITMMDVGTVSPMGATELYFHQLFEFKFGNSQTVLRFAALAFGVILLITAVLPPSLNWLRRRRDDGYSRQQPGW